jgi:hypothetical protein
VHNADPRKQLAELRVQKARVTAQFLSCPAKDLDNLQKLYSQLIQLVEKEWALIETIPEELDRCRECWRLNERIRRTMEALDSEPKTFRYID